MKNSFHNSQIDFLNVSLNFGKQYEELGCSPLSISCIVSNINYKTSEIWVKPTTAQYLEENLSKLLSEWRKKIQDVKVLEECDIKDENIYIFSTINGQLGRCFVVKRKNQKPLIHYIDSGKIEEMPEGTKIYTIDTDMISGELAYPLCFAVKSIPNVYCEKYRMLQLSNIKVGNFVYIIIINATGNLLQAFITSDKKMLIYVKNNFYNKHEIGEKLKKLEKFCRRNNENNTFFVKDDKNYEITEEYIDSFVIGVSDQEHIYVRSVNLSIAYFFFFECLNKYYKKEKIRKELSIEKIDRSNVYDISVLYDSATNKFYRVSIINFNDLVVNCHCIDQPTLVFQNIDNAPNFFWKLADFFKLPSFTCLVKIGNFKSYKKSFDPEIHERRTDVLRSLFKNNNLVHVIKDSCKNFAIVEHEGLDLVEKYKKRLIKLHEDNIDLVTSMVDEPKKLPFANYGDFKKSLNASFCKNGRILGKSLKSQCFLMAKNDALNEKDISDSFGMFNPKNCNYHLINNFLDTFEEDRQQNIYLFKKEYNKINGNSNAH